MLAGVERLRNGGKSILPPRAPGRYAYRWPGLLSPAPRRATPPLGARRVIEETPHADDWSRRANTLGEELFKGALAREQKRADRSNLPVVLLLVEINTDFGVDMGCEWKSVIDALVSAKRETDVLGWFDRGRVLGVIFPETEASDAVAAALDARVRLELTTVLGADTLRTSSIRFHRYPKLRLSGDGAATPIASFPSQETLPRSAAYEATKRGFDLVGSLVLLALLSPLMLLIAALVKITSPGSAFFRQERIGHDMRPFKIIKFRTMHVNSDHAIHQEFVSSFIKPSSKDTKRQNAFFKIIDDPRVTRIGQFLRKTSLDELPQLFNVVCGDMSLVGPRPPVPYEVQQYQRWHCRRVLEAKPGITGLWQVTGRSRTTFDEMVRLDLRYARSRSLLTDVKILLATPKAVIAGRGAC
jgi:lipopolysaccharide/colanic/teichoic acid biosynthesis glycosyltransferase